MFFGNVTLTPAAAATRPTIKLPDQKENPKNTTATAACHKLVHTAALQVFELVRADASSQPQPTVVGGVGGWGRTASKNKKVCR